MSIQNASKRYLSEISKELKTHKDQLRRIWERGKREKSFDWFLINDPYVHQLHAVADRVASVIIAVDKEGGDRWKSTVFRLK